MKNKINKLFLPMFLVISFCAMKADDEFNSKEIPQMVSDDKITEGMQETECHRYVDDMYARLIAQHGFAAYAAALYLVNPALASLVLLPSIANLYGMYNVLKIHEVNVSKDGTSSVTR